MVIYSSVRLFNHDSPSSIGAGLKQIMGILVHIFPKFEGSLNNFGLSKSSVGPVCGWFARQLLEYTL